MWKKNLNYDSPIKTIHVRIITGNGKLHAPFPRTVSLTFLYFILSTHISHSTQLQPSCYLILEWGTIVLTFERNKGKLTNNKVELVSNACLQQGFLFSRFGPNTTLNLHLYQAGKCAMLRKSIYDKPAKFLWCQGSSSTAFWAKTNSSEMSF